jgi:biotin carboxyl carrier protein
MTRYVALLDGGRREEVVGVTQESRGVYLVEVRGKVHRVDAYRHDGGTMSLLVGARSFSVQLDAGATDVKVRIRGSTYPVEILDERRQRLRRATGKFTVEGKQAVTAPMPGKVVKVLAAAGEDVKAGQGVVLIEAMKMENELKSPKDGKVIEMRVVEGQAVEGGATLAVIE